MAAIEESRFYIHLKNWPFLFIGHGKNRPNSSNVYHRSKIIMKIYRETLSISLGDKPSFTLVQKSTTKELSLVDPLYSNNLLPCQLQLPSAILVNGIQICFHLFLPNILFESFTNIGRLSSCQILRHKSIVETIKLLNQSTIF